MAKIIKDYKDLIIKPQTEFIRKHWVSYTIFSIGCGIGAMAFVYRDAIKETIKSKKREG